MNTIPKDSLTEPNLMLRHSDQYLECRWRLLNINNKEYIEISLLKNYKTGEREYLNSNSIWEIKHIDPKYDIYVVKEYYYYLDKI